eukprot:1086029-Amphidinium_carterae.1
MDVETHVSANLLTCSGKLNLWRAECFDPVAKVPLLCCCIQCMHVFKGASLLCSSLQGKSPGDLECLEREGKPFCWSMHCSIIAPCTCMSCLQEYRQKYGSWPGWEEDAE